jgi:uncharacterized YigZ family protein
MDYLSPKGIGTSEIIEKRSRFIGNVAPSHSIEEAEEFIAKIKSRYSDARHNVYAYSVGLNTPIERLSDDGEPRGTAGYPVLEVINKRNLRNAVCVVTRYFGGILLGSGGLLRAYGRAASLAFDAAGVASWVYHSLLQVEIGYDLFGRIKREIEMRGYTLSDVTYREEVLLSTYVPEKEAEPLSRKLVDITNGKAKVSILEGKHLPWTTGK